MRRCGPYLSLEVPGLAEGRPSLLMGDRAIVCEPGACTCLHIIRWIIVLLTMQELTRPVFIGKVISTRLVVGVARFGGGCGQ